MAFRRVKEFKLPYRYFSGPDSGRDQRCCENREYRGANGRYNFGPRGASRCRNVHPGLIRVAQLQARYEGGRGERAVDPGRVSDRRPADSMELKELSRT